MTTLLNMASGHDVDLLAPKIEDIRFCDVAENLAKVARFLGATRDVVYSVAEHSVRGADALLAETDEPRFAAYFLLHDVHEAYLGDDPTPKKEALVHLAEQQFGVLATSINAAFAALTERFDIVIHEAAGLEWPRPPEIERAVHRMDRTMLMTEWRDLKKGPMPFPTWDLTPLYGRIEPWWWDRARDQFYERCRRWLPAMQEVKFG
jgi:5'-deoxynucleotidase YfbR-like HD superfamily hydrolase